MKLQNGFAPVALLLIITAVAVTAIGGYSTFSRLKRYNIDEAKTTQVPSFSQTEFPTSSPTLTPISTTKFLPTRVPVSPTPSTITISVQIHDNGAAINDPSPYFFLRNEDTSSEQILKNSNSGYWIVSNLKPGKYKMYVAYSYNSFIHIDQKCEGCQNKEDISNPGSCGYIVDLHTGDNIKIVCEMRAVHPLGSQSTNSLIANDTIPPVTNLYYPQMNGSITYKTDGKVCAVMTEPSDNQGSNGVETEYQFDNGNWSGYAGGHPYLCADSLPNGQHTLSYHSKDKAGNVESTKTIQFTVNISGN